MIWHKFNINGNVRIKLLPRGIAAFNEHHRELGLDPEIYWKYKQPDADGWRTFQLWEVMCLFGKYCVMGPEPPFETLIEFEMGEWE